MVIELRIGRPAVEAPAPCISWKSLLSHGQQDSSGNAYCGLPYGPWPEETAEGELDTCATLVKFVAVPFDMHVLVRESRHVTAGSMELSSKEHVGLQVLNNQ